MNAQANKSLLTVWKNRLSDKSFKNEFLISIALLIISLIALSNFLLYNELRTGTAINDPILNLYKPVDLTWITFLIIYVGLITAVIYLIKDPDKLSLAFVSYAFTVLVRIAAMYSIPLNPPADIIPLNDPFVQLFGTGNILLKDLFFSGHTSTLFLLFLLIDKKNLKYLFLILTVLVALCVLIQHVHYTIDVIAAPFFAYGTFILAKKAVILIKNKI